MKFPLAVLMIVVLVGVLSMPAFAGCGKWVVRYPETDYLDDPVFDEAVKSSTGASQSLNDEESDEKPQEDVKVASPTPEKVAGPDLSGTWKITLQNMTDRSLELILIQSSDRLQGYGSLALEGSQIPATATGTLSEEEVELDVKLVVDGRLNQMKQEYKLDFDLGDSELSGIYEAYAEDELTGKGNAVAIKS
jgi:hypothetical protein